MPTPRAKPAPIAQAAAMAVKTKGEDESGIEESDDDKNSVGKSSDGSYGVDEIDAGKKSKQEIIKETKVIVKMPDFYWSTCFINNYSKQCSWECN